ncbi:MAG: glycosyltransferase family 4 protein [Hyphomicrobium aestuarii]|nr:glycosyltransferase family 4 protein [Hyphomicrobium aestuarii]
MRILHVLRAPVGGLFRHVIDLACEQSWLGHDVGLVMSTGNDPLTEAKLARISHHLSLGIRRLPMNRVPRFSDVMTCHAVRRAATEVQADIIHGHGAKGGAFARLASVGLKTGTGGKVQVFYTPHGGTLNYSPGSLTGLAYHSVERLLDPLTDGVIFESAHAARVYASVIGAGRAPRRVVHNGLKPSDFNAIAQLPDAADILFIGELRDLKGVEVLLRAIAQLDGMGEGAAVRKPVTAVIVGSGPDQARFVTLAAELGLAQRVTFPGAMPAAEAFPRGRVLAVPSLKESLPYIVLEAAAAAIPLVATNVGGIPEIVAGTDTALVAPGDVEALAASLAATLSDLDAATARAKRLKSSVAGRFTVERMTRDIVDFYAAPAAIAMPVGATAGCGATRNLAPSAATDQNHDRRRHQERRGCVRSDDLSSTISPGP